jgi:hypothetical protein
MWAYCSVMIDVYALASCLLVSVYLWVYYCLVCYCNVPWICSIVVYPGHIIITHHAPMSPNRTLTNKQDANAETSIIIEQYTYIQSSAPEDECNNIRNMLSNKKLS